MIVRDPPWRRGAHEDAVSAALNLEAIEDAIRTRSSATFVCVPNLDLDDVSEIGDPRRRRGALRSLARGAGPLTSCTRATGRQGSHWWKV